MSLSWADRLAVFLASDQVRVVREHLGWRGIRPVHSTAQAVSAGSGWSRVVDALRTALHQGGEFRNERVRVVLSNEFVRYALVPEADELRDENERIVAARHALGAVYGDTVRDWRTTLSQGGFGSSAVAAGMDTEFFDAVLATLQASGLRPTGVEPLLADVLRGIEMARLKKMDRVWLAMVERTNILLALCEAGGFRSLRSQRQRGDLTEQLLGILDQSCLLEGVERLGGPVRLILSGAVSTDGAIEFPPESGWWIDSVSSSAQGRRLRESLT